MTDNIERILQRLELFRIQNKRGYFISLDFKKAFDSVCHEYITETLHDLGSPKWFVSAITSLLHKLEVITTFDTKENVKINIKKGIKQGCCVSPLVFDIILNCLIEELQIKTKGKIEILAYADDLTLVTEDLENLKIVNTVLNSVSKRSGLYLNVQKSMLLPTRRRMEWKTKIENKELKTLEEIGWGQIKIVNRLVHLGILIGNDVTMNDVFTKTQTNMIKKEETVYPIRKT